MSAFDFVVSSLSRLQAKVHEMPLLFAAFATILYWTALFYYRGRSQKVITIGVLFFGTDSVFQTIAQTYSFYHL